MPQKKLISDQNVMYGQNIWLVKVEPFNTEPDHTMRLVWESTLNTTLQRGF